MDSPPRVTTGKPIQILSEVPAFVVPPAAVTVHTVEAGVRRTRVIEAKVPTYFDTVVVSTIHEVTAPGHIPTVTVDSPRNLARFGYHAARRLAMKVRPPLVIPSPTLDTRSQEPNNVAHLIVDLIPYCLYARQVVGAHACFLFRKLEQRYVDLLGMFGIEPRFEAGPVEADIIKVRGARGLAVYDLLGTFDCFGLNFLPRVYDPFTFASPPTSERIFLARRGTRSLGNHAEISAVAQRFGYETVFMEDLPVSAQVSIGAHAKHVIAIHGAAMSFLVASKHIDSVVELLPPHIFHAGYPVYLSPRVARYEQIIPDFDPAVAHSGWAALSRIKGQPFSVDARLLEDVLARIHA